MAKFMTPVIQDNPSGWGPCAVPEQFRDMPYQPFSKGDRLGKVRVCQREPESLNLGLPPSVSSFPFYSLKSIAPVFLIGTPAGKGYDLWVLAVVTGELGTYKGAASRSCCFPTLWLALGGFWVNRKLPA